MFSQYVIISNVLDILKVLKDKLFFKIRINILLFVM
jgi:hypothetical protein